MRRCPGPWLALLLTAVIGGVGARPCAAQDHLLLTEYAVTPTDGEFLEIYNPTSAIVDLSNYYVSDFVLASDPASNYYRIVDGGLQPDPAFPNDFLARFPDGSTIGPGQTIVVSIHDDAAFTSTWSGGGNLVKPDYEMVDDGTADGVPAMVDPGPEIVGSPYIQSQAGLSNSRECIVLFYWDGESDLVQDVDIVQWSNAGPVFNTVSPNKTGAMTDGPDPDTMPSAYLPDTDPQGQDLADDGQHEFGRTVSRADFTEGQETKTGGNGITGNDETSENLSVTWVPDTAPSIGSPGDFGPPALVFATSTGEGEVEVVFSRALDPASAGTRANFSVVQIQTSAGAVSGLPVPVRGAELLGDGVTVRLATDALEATAFFELQVRNVRTADLSETVVAGSRVFFRGFNPGPGLELSVPKRPFVPHLDGEIEIRYVAPQGEEILLRVFDLEGRELFILADEPAPRGGVRTLRWDGRDDLRQRLPGGVYILHLETPGNGDRTTVPVVIAIAPKGVLR